MATKYEAMGLKEGAIMRHRTYSDLRVIFMVANDDAYYVNYNMFDSGDWSFNPTHSAVSLKSMDEKFEVVGHLTPTQLDHLRQSIMRVNKAFNGSMVEFSEATNDNPEMDISRFIDHSRKL